MALVALVALPNVLAPVAAAEGDCLDPDASDCVLLVAGVVDAAENAAADAVEFLRPDEDPRRGAIPATVDAVVEFLTGEDGYGGAPAPLLGYVHEYLKERGGGCTADPGAPHCWQ